MKTILSYLPRPRFLAILAVAVAAATAAQAQIKVLFLGADPVPQIDAVRADILGSDSRFDIAGSASFDWSLSLPSLATLNTYDAVLVWSNIANITSTISDRLADYIDAGGGLVLGSFWGNVTHGFAGGGRLETGGYNPLTNPTGDPFAPASLGVYDATSSLFDGVTSLSAFEFRGDYAPGLAPGATLVGSWDDGSPLLAYNADQNVVALTLYPNVATYAHADGDYQQLFRNSLAFVGAGVTPVPEPSTYALIGSALLLSAIATRRLRQKRELLR